MTALKRDYFISPLGLLHLVASKQGICLVEFSDRAILKKELTDLERLLNARVILGENDHTRHCKEELGAYFAGTLKHFSVPIHLAGTPFQQRVWRSLQTIPYGEILSYSEQARRIGRPSACRAVASTNGKNRISIILPCHRVIGKNGTLTGYGGGLERKKWLLLHEAKYC